MTKEERHLASQLKACAKKMKSKMYHTRTFPLLCSEYIRLRRNDWDCYCYLEQPPIDEVDAWERERSRKKWCKRISYISNGSGSVSGTLLKCQKKQMLYGLCL